MKPLSIFIALILKFSFSFSQIPVTKKVNNIKAFTKLTGYIQYFYPSDEAAAMDWHKFIYYGTQKVENCTTDSELIDSLKMLFENIAPLAQIGSKTQKYIDTRKINKSDTTAYTFWQHDGYGYGDPKMNRYRNIRINRQNILPIFGRIDTFTKKLFSTEPTIDTIITKQLKQNIYLRFPLVLQCDSLHTYPIVEQQKVNLFKAKVHRFFPKVETGNDLYIRLSNIAIFWNVVQHLYPYKAHITGNWDNLLKTYLLQCYVDETEQDFLKSLGFLASHLNEAHIGNVNHVETNNRQYVLPIKVERIQNQFVVTAIDTGVSKFKVGDIIEAIDKKPMQLIYENIFLQLSGSTHFKEAWASWLLTSNEKNTALIKLKNKPAFNHFKVKASSTKIHTNNVFLIHPGAVDEGVFYLNLNNLTDSIFHSLLPQLQVAKVIIVDIRRRPLFIKHYELLDYFITKPTTQDWLFREQVVYPDFSSVSFKGGHWSYNIDTTKLLKAKVYFITGPLSMSYSESLIGNFKYNTNATLVGQSSAGVNGDIFRLNLLGGYNAALTGIKVLQQNGEQLFAIGFKPDIYVERTIKGIKENRDEFLDRAILEAKKYLKKNN